jgi:hypothetical protein
MMNADDNALPGCGIEIKTDRYARETVSLG